MDERRVASFSGAGVGHQQQARSGLVQPMPKSLDHGTFGEEVEAMEPVPSTPAEPRRIVRSEARAARRTSTPQEGALERHRLNIEE